VCLQALHQTLLEMLEAATQQDRGQEEAGEGSKGGASAWTDLQRAVGSRPRWAACVAAAARHPALHLAVRQVLHGWLADSGHPAVWRLLLLHLHAARAAQQGELAAEQRLPAQLAVLYPAGLAAAAAVLHTRAPCVEGLHQVLAHLQLYTQPAQQQPRGRAQRAQHAWRLLLDAPAWLSFCLQQLPLPALVELARRGGPCEAQGGAGAGAAPAARFVALLMWPGEPRRQQVLEDALALQLGDVDLPALRPWLEVLAVWREFLRGCPLLGDTSGDVLAADA
jgi:hypothetical protein